MHIAQPVAPHFLRGPFTGAFQICRASEPWADLVAQVFEVGHQIRMVLDLGDDFLIEGQHRAGFREAPSRFRGNWGRRGSGLLDLAWGRILRPGQQTGAQKEQRCPRKTRHARTATDELRNLT